MENAEEIFHYLEDFSKRKPKVIPQELNDYLAYVARTGDPVYQWTLVKSLFKEKLLNVITDFHETTPGIEIPPYPNVDPFNYDIMKNSLLERLDSFSSAPFTVQRICELLTYPRKQYNRVDKYMRAVEKNILVVSTREPGVQRHVEAENGEPTEPIVNGSDNNSEYNVDVEMEDMSWKENAEQRRSAEPQPSSSETHITVDDIEARLQAKQDAQMETTEKSTIQYDSVTPPELNSSDELSSDSKPKEEPTADPVNREDNKENVQTDTPCTIISPKEDIKIDEDIKPKISSSSPLVIPEIKVDDAEMTEQKLQTLRDNTSTSQIASSHEEHQTEKQIEDVSKMENQPVTECANTEQPDTRDEVEEPKEPEIITSSEESSSSSDNTDGNSNSPKTDQVDVHDDSNQSENNEEKIATKKEDTPEVPKISDKTENFAQVTLQTDNYTISDVNSELPTADPDTKAALEPDTNIVEETTPKEPETQTEEAKPAEQHEASPEIPVST